MARRPDTTAATETLHEIESVFDRMAGWVTENPSRFFTLVGCLLGLTAAVGLANWWSDRAEAEASRAVARAVADYRMAMGAMAGAVEIPEPADPEAARAAREQAVADLLAVADEHRSSLSALPAFLEAGNLQTELGETEAAIASWQRGADSAPRDSEIRGLLLSRLGRGLEAAGRWAEAAAAHAEAASIEAYPVRHFAMADAARCYAEAGQRDEAVALFDRVEEEAPGLAIPEHVRARLRELRLAGS